MRKIVTFTLIIFVALFFIPRLTSTAYGQTNGGEEKQAIQVISALPPAAPSAVFYGKAIGSISPGDLYYVDAAGSPANITLNLSITNTGELIHYLKYLTLQVAIYVGDENGQWMKPQADSEESPETYLTLQNSPVVFTLPGGARYKVTINSGCFYCLSAGNAGDNIEPRFYLDAGTQ